MNKKQTRREFVSKGCQFGLACGAFALCPKLIVQGNVPQEEVPDPKKLDYCGYICPPDCPLYVATIENNNEKKKEAYIMWKMQERYGVPFDPEQIFCYGCKNPGKPEGIVLNRCTVRLCAIENGYDCCIECDNLSDCNRDLWNRYPEFHKEMIDTQTKYKAAKDKA
jgi:hypothetical protein